MDNFTRHDTARTEQSTQVSVIIIIIILVSQTLRQRGNDIYTDTNNQAIKY